MASWGTLLAGLLTSLFQGTHGEQPLRQQLCDAVAHRNCTESGRLLALGADPNVVCAGSFAAPLHRAADEGSVCISKALLEHSAKIETTDIWGRTPLHHAAQKGRTVVVKALLSRGAQVDEKDHYGNTPLFYALSSTPSAGPTVEALLAAGASNVALVSSDVLHLAAGKGQTDKVKALLKLGADVEAMNDERQTALHLAAKRGHLAVVKVLVDNNADVLAMGSQMETPLELARSSQDQEGLDVHSKEEKKQVAEWLSTHGGAQPTPTSVGSWAHVLWFHPLKVAACAGIGVLLAGVKTTLEWAHSRGVSIATQDPSTALVRRLVPSTGALRLAAKAIAKDHRCGPLVNPMKLLTNLFAAIASLLFVCGPCMWVVKPLYVAAVAGPAFLVPALCTFGWQKIVNFPVLVIAAKTPAGRCRVATTSLLVTVVLLIIWEKFDVGNDRTAGCVFLYYPHGFCNLNDHDVSFSFSVGGFGWRGGLADLHMDDVHTLLFLVLLVAMLVWVLGVAVTTPCCCRLPVVSRAAAEKLAHEIDSAGGAGELPQLHPKLQPAGLSGIVVTTAFAALDILSDLTTIATFIVTYNFWFAGVLWTVFLASLGSELVKGNIQALPGELKRTLATGVMTERLIELLDTDKGFEAPFSLAITIYAMPFVARNGDTFLRQCFSLITSSVSIASFLSNYVTMATLADQPDVDESETTSSEGSEGSFSPSDSSDGEVP